MNIRTIALSLALSAAALLAPPAISTARACGGYMTPEMLMSWAAEEQISTRWGVGRDKIDILEVALQDDGTAEVDVRIRTGKTQAIGRRYKVSRGPRGYRVAVTPVAWVERLTNEGWRHA
jgi:hypothetical protein